MRNWRYWFSPVASFLLPIAICVSFYLVVQRYGFASPQVPQERACVVFHIGTVDVVPLAEAPAFLDFLENQCADIIDVSVHNRGKPGDYEVVFLYRVPIAE